jgi:hypothetical protein
MNYAALVGTASAIVIAIMGAAWMLSGRVSRLETKIEDMPERMDGRMRLLTQTELNRHEDMCPARRDYTTGVREAGQ